MRFYQVHMTCEGGCSAGSRYYTNSREAYRQANTWKAGNPEENATVKIIEVNPTKEGILSLLNVHASHPDNG